VSKSPITLCGSLSLHPVSLGAEMHMAGYRELGLPFTYVPFAVEQADLSGAIAGMRALSIRGFGVSMPFKLSVIPLLDRLDDLARRIGAVNTIVNDDGVLSGHNTDAWGAARALEEALVLADKRVMVLGAGGAARAVVHSFASEGMRVTLVNRTLDKATALAEDVNRHGLAHPVETRAWDGRGELAGFDAVVNCSSAGMEGYGHEGPMPVGALRPELVVMDIVYKPVRTALVEAAERAGARSIHGGRMLLHQACRQFELYTGRTAPLEAMNAAQARHLGAS
jgi:shikimate dehydrogenase